jgi:hypothetical protein
MASRVRLGVAMLKDINGVGERVSDVNDDIVIALGVCPCVEVQTTTECGRSRIIDRICSERAAGDVGSAVGGMGNEVCHELSV